MLNCDKCKNEFYHLTLDIDENNKDVFLCCECRKKLNKKITHRKYIDVEIKSTIKKVNLNS